MIEVKDLAEMLKVNGSLKKMNLFGNSISAEGAKGLAEALTVGVRWNTSIWDVITLVIKAHNIWQTC